jgi:AcrR family transcriptional regulator
MAAQAMATPDPRPRQVPATSADELSTRLVDTARRLMWQSGGPGFTVNQVVMGSGTSLKSFYRLFSGKDELLVALFRDDARIGAESLAALVDEHADPTDRVHTAVIGLFRFITADGQLPYAAALVREHLRLAESRPAELRSVLAPFVELFTRELADAQSASVLRRGDAARDARTLFHLVISHLHALVCHQIDDPPRQVAEDLWAFCAAALRPGVRPDDQT